MFRDGRARVLVFRVGAERFGAALSSIDEVIDAPVIQPLPDSPATVRGVTSIRGALATVYDPRPLLHVDGTADGAALVCTRDGRRIALAVDDVQDALIVEEDELRAVAGMDTSDGILLGVVRRGAELVALIDVDALFDAAVDEGERT